MELGKRTDKLNKHINIDIKGMHCASCSSLVTLSLKNRKGVEDVSVNLLTNSAALIIDDREIDVPDIVEIINDLGYKASLAEEGVKKKP